MLYYNIVSPKGQAREQEPLLITSKYTTTSMITVF